MAHFDTKLVTAYLEGIREAGITTIDRLEVKSDDETMTTIVVWVAGQFILTDFSTAKNPTDNIAHVGMSQSQIIGVGYAAAREMLNSIPADLVALAKLASTK